MSYYDGKRVLVTGGLGFIGSTLAIRLAGLGARVTVVDNLEPGGGGNRFNLASVARQVDLVEADIGDTDRFAALLPEQDIIFNLAGEVSHGRSMSDPERDLRLNTISQLRFLRACAQAVPGCKVVYAGTRQVYGRAIQLPVDEAHPARPVDFNGVHKLAAEQYHLLLDRLGLLDCTVLRLTNVYGPRMALGVPGQGFLVTYVSRLMRGLGLEVYGDGSQLRDPVYVNDAAEAFLRAGEAGTTRRKIFNVGGPEGLTLTQIAHITARAAGGVSVQHRPFPEGEKPIDIGSFQADTRRARRLLNWSPVVSFEAGIRRTLDYYELHSEQYLAGAGLRKLCAAETVAIPSATDAVAMAR